MKSQHFPVLMVSAVALTFVRTVRAARIVVDHDVSWREPYEEMKTQVETMWAPLDRYYHNDPEGRGITHGCRPVVHIPEHPPTCFAVLVHGFSSCPDAFGHYLPPLAEEGCLVVLPALPGHGWKEGGGRNNMPGIRNQNSTRDKIPQPEQYFQLVFNLARIFKAADVGSISNKMIAGLSMGGSTASMLAIAADVKWDRVLIMNPNFVVASPGELAFRFPYSTPLTWASDYLLDHSVLDTGFCDHRHHVTAPGYCAMYASTFVSIFQFSAVAMGVWEVVSLITQGNTDEAQAKLREQLGYVLKMGSEGGTMVGWNGLQWELPERESADKDAWVAWGIDENGRREEIFEMLWAGASHAALSQTMTVQLLSSGPHGDDHKIGTEGLQQFMRHARVRVNGQDTHFCSFPAAMPHAWIRPYVNISRVYWWVPYTSDAVKRFAFSGREFPKTDGTEDVCFVDAAVDDPPFSGRVYKASYTVFEPPDLIEHQDDFELANPSGSLWRMSREEFGESWMWRSAKAHIAQFVVQPLIARMTGSTRGASELHEQPILVERGLPSEWGAALHKPIQAAWAKAVGNCEEVELPSAWVHPMALPGLTESSNVQTCVAVPVHRLMAQHETNDLVQALVTGSLFNPHGESSTLHFCGEHNNVQGIIDHICHDEQ